MKNNFSELFDHMDAGELDELLAGVQNEPLDGMTARRIREAALENAGLAEQKTQRPKRRRWLYGTLAACLALILGLGTYAYAMENKAYNEAVRFFNENHLSIDGLTRGEIKAVYRDITTASFTYAKTAEVIGKGLSTARVDGYAIPQEVPDALTPEQVQAMWNDYHLGLNRKGIRYSIDYVETINERGVYLGVEKCIVSKYDGPTLLWQADIRTYVADKCYPVTDGVIVCGQTEITDSRQNQSAWMTKLDENGHEVWRRRLENGFLDEYICTVVAEDGGYAVISRGDYKTVCFSRYSADGQRTHMKKMDLGNYGVMGAARLGDGYLVQLGSWTESEFARIVRLDHDGNLIGDFSYSGEDTWYYITDMAEFDGKVYLSAYAVPKLPEDEANAGGRDEIAGVLNVLFKRLESGEDDGWYITDEELTPMMRDNYTAVLLVCDPDGGQPETFYQVEGSLGGKLSVSEQGELLWDVESFASTFFSPATSAFSIGGTCQVYRYTFDGSGTLVSQVKTDETTMYRR